MESTDKAVEVYQLRIWIRQISPQIWRRLLVRSDSTIAELHAILQIAFDWSNEHLHRFLIRGKPYGIARIGGIQFDDNPRQVQLRDFHFRQKEVWVYEYDLTDWWQHEIRLEQVVPLDPAMRYPLCVAGRRRGPIEDCGGPEAFMVLQDEYPQWKVLEIVPQQGQDAVGEAARMVTVTSLVMLTCSMTRSERSGRIVIGSHGIRKMSCWKNLFGPLVYHIWHQRACGRTILCVESQLCHSS